MLYKELLLCKTGCYLAKLYLVGEGDELDEDGEREADEDVADQAPTLAPALKHVASHLSTYFFSISNINF